jgi:hypothetical protein
VISNFFIPLVDRAESMVRNAMPLPSPARKTLAVILPDDNAKVQTTNFNTKKSKNANN